MAQVPSNLIPTRITQLQEAPVASPDGFLLYTYNGNTYKVRAGELLQVAGVLPSRQVIAGTGLTGGGQLSSDVTLSVAPKGLGASQLMDTGVTPGLYGGGLTTPQINIDSTGRVTSAVEVTSTPDMEEAVGVLDMGHGGTGRNLIPVPGAFVYTDANGMQMMSQGEIGQVPVSTANGAPVWASVLTQVPVPANFAYIGPLFGPDAMASFRALQNDDLPIVDIGHGGTNATTATGARSNLSAAVLGVNNDITALTTINAGISAPEFIDFDLAPPGVRATGRLWWDPADGVQTLSLGMAGSNATLQIGEETYFRVKATTAITEANVVMLTGSVGASGALTGSPATGLTPATAQLIMGLATGDIPLNGWGYVTEFGLVRGINTTGSSVGETWVDGDILYYNPVVSGGLTKILPSAPNAKVVVAAVVHVHASQGALFVRPSFGGILGQYEGDISITSPANGQLLVRDQTAGVWKNATLTDGTGVSITEGAGSVTVGLAANYGDTLNPYASKTANFVLAAPNGAAGAPSFRSIVAADIPTLNQNTTGTASNVTGVVVVANGGSGRATGTTAYSLIATGTTATGAQQTLANGATTQLLVGGGAAALPVWTTATGSGAPVRATSPTLVTPNLGTPSAATLTNATGLPIIAGTTGTLTVARGGTGVATLTGIVKAAGTANFAAAAASDIITLIGASPVANATNATTSVNLAGGAASNLPYQTGAGATAFIANGVAGQVLTSAGAAVPSWGGLNGGTF